MWCKWLVKQWTRLAAGTLTSDQMLHADIDRKTDTVIQVSTRLRLYQTLWAPTWSFQRWGQSLFAFWSPSSHYFYTIIFTSITDLISLLIVFLLGQPSSKKPKAPSPQIGSGWNFAGLYLKQIRIDCLPLDLFLRIHPYNDEWVSHAVGFPIYKCWHRHCDHYHNIQTL